MCVCKWAWVYGCMGVWGYECMGAWVHGCMRVCVYICVLGVQLATYGLRVRPKSGKRKISTPIGNLIAAPGWPYLGRPC